MMKIIAHDTVNDVAIIETTFAISVRYGLDITECSGIDEALEKFAACVRHALACEGHYD